MSETAKDTVGEQAAEALDLTASDEADAAGETAEEPIEEKLRPSLDLAPLLGRLRTGRLQAALIALVVVAAGVLGWQLTHAPEQKASRPVAKSSGSYTTGSVPAGQDALRVAVKALPAALTYDYRTLDRSRAKATALMTPAFAKDFSATYDDTVGKLATQKQAVTKAIVRGGGVLKASDQKVTALVFVDQVLVTSNQTKGTAPVTVAQSRVVVDLTRSGDAWRV
ncbi:MAG: hypothetical protein J2O46_00810, partial [Nocardioides sp.]|nr:hypothetical protein [Nocardioides sp.]